MFIDIVKNLAKSPIIRSHQTANALIEFGSKITIIKDKIPFGVLNFRFGNSLETPFTSQINMLAKAGSICNEFSNNFVS